MHGSKIEFPATGTNWIIEFDKNLGEAELKNLASEIVGVTDDFEDNYSRFREESLLSELSSKKGIYTLPKDAKDLFDFYLELYKITNGKFTPLAGEMLSAAGYDKEYSFKKKELPKSLPKVDEVMEYNFPTITIKNPQILDFGAAGKGYLIDIVGSFLENKGYSEFTIDAGGDILHRSEEDNLKIGLEHPTDLEKIIGVVNIKNRSICGSSGNRRKWEEFHHIMDPENFQSPSEVLSTWVIADKALVADGLATSLFLVEPENLTEKYDFEYLILYKDFSIKHSEGFPAEYF